MHMKSEKTRSIFFFCVDHVLLSELHLCKAASFLTISLNRIIWAFPPNNLKVFEEMESPFEHQSDLTNFSF